MTDTTTYGLTPVQDNVIAAITGGATMKAAAVAVGIHRNTIGYWGKTSVAFREALQAAQYDKAIFIREEAENHVTDAFTAIHEILTKPDVSDTARLNAAKYIIEKASTPPPLKPEAIYQVENAEIVPNHAQCPAQTSDPAQSHPAAQTQQTDTLYPKLASNRKASPARKVGRNEPCPCGSHLKFKRCCLGKASLAAAA